MAQENISAQLNDLLASRDFQAELLDKEGRPTDAENADIFTFDYVSSGGKNYGTMVIILDADNEMQVFYGDNLGRSMEGDDKTEFFDFVQHLHKFANMRRWTYSPKNINQVKYTMQGLAAIKEGLFEGYYGTRKVSYSGEPTEARLVIQHNRTLGEADARFRYVESLFIETADSERYRLQFKNLAGGRAMLEHVRQGGKPYDVRGSHITEMVSEIATLSRFNRASAGRVLEGVTAELVTEAQQYYKSLRENLKRMAGTRGYQAYFESWHPAETTLQEELVDSIKTMFVEQTLDSRIEAALPVLARLQQENRMKEADIFESWADNLSEGTWALPDTPEKHKRLQDLMSRPLIVGPDATNATEQLDDLVGDDRLFDYLEDLAARDASANVWDDTDVQLRLGDLGIQLPGQPPEDDEDDVDVDATAGADQQPPVQESRVKELSMDLEDPLMSDEEFETKYGDSRANMQGRAGRVQDRKTGKFYDPEQEFDKLKNSPEFGAQMRRMAQQDGVTEDAKKDMSKEVKAMATGTCPHCKGPVKKKEFSTLTQYHCPACGIRASQDKSSVAEGDVFRRHGKNRNPTIAELEMWIKNWTSFQIGGNLTDAGRAKVGQSIAKAQRLLAKKKQQQGVAEAEKNPHTSALGRALYRDLSKEKKASPAQVQRNKERWAQRQADKGQGVAEGSSIGPTIKANKIYYADHVVILDPEIYNSDPALYDEYVRDIAGEDLDPQGDAKYHKYELDRINNDGSWTIKKLKPKGVAEAALKGTAKEYAAKAQAAEAKYLKYEDLVDQELQKLGQRLPQSWDAGRMNTKLSSHPKYALALKYYTLSEKFASQAIRYEQLARKQGMAEGSDIGYHQTSGTKAGYVVSSRKLSNKPQASKSDVTLQSGSMHHRGKSYNFPKGTLFTQLPGGIFAKHPDVPETAPGYGHVIRKNEDNINKIHAALGGVAEAGNRPVDWQFPLGTGDTRTARELKTQMQGAGDEFVKGAAKTTGPMHSRVAKMQSKLAQSELRRRQPDVVESLLSEYETGLDSDQGLEDNMTEAKMSPQQQNDFDRMRYGAMSRKEYDAKWKKPQKSDDQVIYGKKPAVAEAGTCNHTMEGEMCPEHGLAECGMHESQVQESQQHLADLARLKSLAHGK